MPQLHHFAGAQLSYGDVLAGRHLLVSYAEEKQRKLVEQIDWPYASLICDSGAFSAWNSQNKSKPIPPIVLDEYMAFIEKHAHKFKAYVALDVIPGQPGVPQTEDEIRWALEKSIWNLGYMESRGFTPMPVFHEPDPPELLEWMVGKGYPLIGIAGTFNRGKKALLPWLDGIFAKFPHQRFHGLAMTQRGILEDHARFPFASIDSISWLNLAKFGPDANFHMVKGLSDDTRRAYGIDLGADRKAVCDYINSQTPRFRRELGVRYIEDVIQGGR